MDIKLVLVGIVTVVALGLLPAPKTTGISSEETVLPPSGVVLPIVWGSLGQKLVSTGVIDANKFTVTSEETLTITEDNARQLLNLFWALGLANKNPILEDKEGMMNPKYGGAGNFASTGGWTPARGSVMEHYGAHALVALTPAQQALVERVSKNIYRPCCGNATHFPDCNHGMAMLGLLELMASQGVSEEGMYKTALAVNSYWFPDTYRTIAAYMKNKNIEWKDVDPQEVLGSTYSSASGYAKIAAAVDARQGGKGIQCSA